MKRGARATTRAFSCSTYWQHRSRHVTVVSSLASIPRYAGMLEMYETVRRNAPGAVIVVAGQKQYAYDAESLIRLDAEHPELTNIVWNAHP